VGGGLQGGSKVPLEKNKSSIGFNRNFFLSMVFSFGGFMEHDFVFHGDVIPFKEV
jgi:hypothetical protein